MNINDVCDYIIVKTKEGGETLNLLKLHKLLYYTQAWHLAFYNKPLFEGKFQAWVHGPVSREIYERFAQEKSLYSEMRTGDIAADFDIDAMPAKGRRHIDDVLEVYAKYRGSQLEEMSHQEEPWLEARKGYRPSERCEREISEDTMRRYYAKRVASE
jgi:uncharacterized phage-associated protein